jgi:hypothetical protein
MKRNRNRQEKNTARERAWRVMRIIRTPFTIKDIARLSESEVANLTHYLYTLRKAGYFVVVGYRSMPPRPGRERLFRLVKNTGPKPPIQKNPRHLYDPNIGEYWIETPKRINKFCLFKERTAVSMGKSQK